ncbi:hypothetical protein ACV1DC_09090, partial [Aeromonas caviae]
AEFTVGEGKLMTHDEPCSMAPDDKHYLISGTCSHLPYLSPLVGLIILKLTLSARYWLFAHVVFSGR